MAIHSALRWWRKQCQKETRAHNATVPRKREAGGSAQDQQPYFIAASAWLRGVEKAVAEKFKQAGQKRAADDRRKDDADEVAKKLLCGSGRRRSSPRSAESKRSRQRTLADDKGATVLDRYFQQAQEAKTGERLLMVSLCPPPQPPLVPYLPLVLVSPPRILSQSSTLCLSPVSVLGNLPSNPHCTGVSTSRRTLPVTPNP